LRSPRGGDRLADDALAFAVGVEFVVLILELEVEE
jgi:hypothetical protein